VLFCTIIVNDVLKVLASMEEDRSAEKIRTVPVKWTLGTVLVISIIHLFELCTKRI